jgi:hypothetical protein
MEEKYKSYNREIEFFFDGFNGVFLVCEKGKSDLDKEQFSKVTFTITNSETSNSL